MWYLFWASQSIACVCVFNSSTPCIISSSKVFLFLLFVLILHVWMLSCYTQKSGDHLFHWRVRLVHPFSHYGCPPCLLPLWWKQLLPLSSKLWAFYSEVGGGVPDFQPVSLHLASVCPSYPLLMAPGVFESGTSLESWGKTSYYVLLIIYHFALMGQVMQ